MFSLPEIKTARILLVDDLPANVAMLELMLKGAGYVSTFSTTNPRLVSGLHRENPYDLILLDLQMPGMDGFQVIEELRHDDPEGYLPVLVISAQPDQKLRALQAGSRDFVSKPFVLAEVLARVHNLLEVRLLHRQLRESNGSLELRVVSRTADLREGYLETIFAMTRAAEHKDEDTGAHVQRISYYCRELSTELGLDPEFVDRIFFASPMHDIGKIGIPDHILLKPGSLTHEEWEVMKGHAAMGAEILGASKSPFLQMGAEVALNHHERWDGGGYPGGKVGEGIPLSARIMNICDVYDALRSKRPYKPAFSHERSVETMLTGDGRTSPAHFDPALLDCFARSHRAFSRIYDAT